MKHISIYCLFRLQKGADYIVISTLLLCNQHLVIT